MKEKQVARLLPAEAPDAIDSAAVIAYLRSNPDFFIRNEEVLCDVLLPHRAGSAVSLVERQVTLLRERSIDARHRLNALLEAARDNEALFAKTRKLILSLLEASGLDELVERLAGSLRADFDAEQCRLVLIQGGSAEWAPDAPQIRLEAAETSIRSLLGQRRPVVGALRAQEKSALFGDAADSVHSAAVVPIRDNGPIALLALGSSDQRRFHGEMGTLFLDFIAEVLQRLLPRFATGV